MRNCCACGNEASKTKVETAWRDKNVRRVVEIYSQGRGFDTAEVKLEYAKKKVFPNRSDTS